MIIRNSRLKPLTGKMLLVQLMSVGLFVLMLVLHAETKEHLPGYLGYSGMEIPYAEQADFYSVDKIIITVTQNGVIYLDDKRIDDIEDLTLALTSLKVRMERPIVVLWADKSVAYERIMEVMDSVRKLDMLLLFVTRTKEKPSIRKKYPKVGE